MKHTESNGHEVESDGRMVWVNDPDQCVARLGPNGAEVLTDKGWSVSRPGAWGPFVELVGKLYGVEIGDEHRPDGVPR